MNIKLHKNRTIFIVSIVLILVISTVSYVFSMFADAKEDVDQNITNLSRGTYDILIRPENARTDLEKELNVIEENYLGIGDGGITIEEWEDIKEHPQVEIAAPVASIGLFTAEERTFMLKQDLLDMKYYEVEYFTSDGVETYEHNEEIYMYEFGRGIEEHLRFPSSEDVASNYMALEDASFIFPTSYHQVVAVDAEEEGNLTDFDLSPIEERRMSNLDAYKGGSLSTPIMTLSDANIPVQVKLTIDELAEPSEKELEEWYHELGEDITLRSLIFTPDQYFDVIDDYVSEKRLHQEEIYELKPDENHSPFSHGILHLDDDMKLRLETDEWPDPDLRLGQRADVTSNRIGYQLDPVVYDVKDNETLTVQQIDEDDEYGAPVYREMEEMVFYELNEKGALPKDDDEYLGFLENGTFSIEENTSDLASSPLGIYGSEAPYLASDPSKELHPSAVPGSFITTPAHGLISIDHAEHIKGEQPIDAIRVKVAGITGYDRQAAKLIEDLANEWEEKGFTVDIVAGASLQDLTVEVEGIGDVVQSFTTLGAAETTVSSWNAIQMGMTVLYGLVALTFVGFTFFNLLKDRLRDEQLLARIGWPQKLIRRLRYKEWGLMLGIPIILVFVGFTVLGFWQDEWLPLILSGFVSVVFIGLFFLGEWLKNRSPKQVKKQAKSVTLQNVRYYSSSLLAACIQLVLVTVLTCFLPFFLIQTVQMTTKTRLGAYVHGEIEGIFIIVIILLYALSLTTIYQTLKRMWEKRESEIQLFLYLGWEAKSIRNYFVNEVFIWAGISIVVGWIISLVTTMMMIEVSLATILLQVAGFVVILAVTIVSSIYSLHRVKIKGGTQIENQAS